MHEDVPPVEKTCCYGMSIGPDNYMSPRKLFDPGEREVVFRTVRTYADSTQRIECSALKPDGNCRLTHLIAEGGTRVTALREFFRLGLLAECPYARRVDDHNAELQKFRQGI